MKTIKFELGKLFDVSPSSKIKKEIVSEKEIMVLHKAAFENLGVLNTNPFQIEQCVFSTEKPNSKPKLVLQAYDYILFLNRSGFVFETVLQNFILTDQQNPKNLLAVKGDDVDHEFIIIREKVIDRFKNLSGPHILNSYIQILLGQCGNSFIQIAQQNQMIDEKIAQIKQIPVILPSIYDQNKIVFEAMKYAERMKTVIEAHRDLNRDLRNFYQNISKEK